MIDTLDQCTLSLLALLMVVGLGVALWPERPQAARAQSADRAQ